MKKLILLCALFGILSCGNDDSPSEVRLTAPVLKRLGMSNASGELGTTFDFNYDSNRRIATAIITGAINRTVTFTYDNSDRIIKASRSDGQIVDFVYDSQDTLLSYTLNADNSDVDFNPVTLEYNYIPMAYEVNSAGDVTHINLSIMTFDTQQKGSLANIVGKKLQLILFLSDPAFEYAFSTSAMTSVSTDDFGNPIFTVAFDNTYDENGMLTTTILRRNGATQGGISYTYENP